MTEELNFETYLSVSKYKFEIFLFDKKNLKNIYKDKLQFKSKLEVIDLDRLSEFLDKNIFKIEKLAGTFIKNIFIIMESDENLNVNICLKKKNYENLQNKKKLEITLTEVKNLFNENYQEQNILHMTVSNYIINGKIYLSFESDFNCDHLCLEVNFISISNNLMFTFEKILENYQISVSQYLNENYIVNFFKEENIELSEMAHKILNGYNENEVILVPKNIENKGFFEKFFQLFG